MSFKIGARPTPKGFRLFRDKTAELEVWKKRRDGEAGGGGLQEGEGGRSESLYLSSPIIRLLLGNARKHGQEAIRVNAFH